MGKQLTKNQSFTFEEMTAFLDLDDPEITIMRKENPALYLRYLTQLVDGVEGVQT